MAVKDCSKLLSHALPGLPGIAAAATDGAGLLCAGAAGERALGGGVAMDVESVFPIYSATKALTATLCLQLAEEGKLDLDAPAGQYLPALDALPVIEGFDEATGEARIRPAHTRITTRMLLLHTAGFGYPFFNATCQRYARTHKIPPVTSASHHALETPLLFEPGTAWEYGTGIDWAGRVVEALTGKRLGTVMAERLLEPLGMKDTGFTLTTTMASRLVGLHQRTPEGALTPLDMRLPDPPENDMGGHGLYATVLDYTKFLRLWLNEGKAPCGARLLSRESVSMALRNGLHNGQTVGALPAIAPKLTRPADFYAETPRGWGLSFLLTENALSTGRGPGSAFWAGLANIYYWLDPAKGVAGIWAAQLYPFADPAALTGFEAFERMVYADHATQIDPATPDVGEIILRT